MEEFKLETNLFNIAIFDYDFFKEFLGANLTVGSQDWKMKKYSKEILH